MRSLCGRNPVLLPRHGPQGQLVASAITKQLCVHHHAYPPAPLRARHSVGRDGDAPTAREVPSFCPGHIPATSARTCPRHQGPTEASELDRVHDMLLTAVWRHGPSHPVDVTLRTAFNLCVHNLKYRNESLCKGMWQRVSCLSPSSPAPPPICFPSLQAATVTGFLYIL